MSEKPVFKIRKVLNPGDGFRNANAGKRQKYGRSYSAFVTVRVGHYIVLDPKGYTNWLDEKNFQEFYKPVNRQKDIARTNSGLFGEYHRK